MGIEVVKVFAEVLARITAAAALGLLAFVAWLMATPPEMRADFGAAVGLWLVGGWAAWVGLSGRLWRQQEARRDA